MTNSLAYYTCQLHGKKVYKICSESATTKNKSITVCWNSKSCINICSTSQNRNFSPFNFFVKFFYLNFQNFFQLIRPRLWNFFSLSFVVQIDTVCTHANCSISYFLFEKHKWSCCGREKRKLIKHERETLRDQLIGNLMDVRTIAISVQGYQCRHFIPVFQPKNEKSKCSQACNLCRFLQHSF